MTEQLKLTRRMIDKRKDLFAITRADELRLLSARPFIEENIDDIVEQFYQQQLAHSEIEIVIGDADTLLRLRNSMRVYILDLFSGVYDEYYVTSRLRVGKVHKRIGVSPTLYMAGVSILSSILTQYIKQVNVDSLDSLGETELLKQSLYKLMMFDVQFVFETYTGSLVAEVEKAKQELEDYARDLEQEISARTRELEALSRIDSLTGLLNQRAFYEQLRIDVAMSSRRKDTLTLIYLDLNLFKQVNDSQGHTVGDRILANVGQCMQQVVREGNFGCRYGGDEFCIILNSTTDDQSKEVCSRLITCFNRLENNSSVSFSMGLFQTGPDLYLAPEEIVKEADRRMYLAKAASKKDAGFWLCDSGEKLVNLNVEQA